MDLDVEWSSLWNGPKGGHLGWRWEDRPGAA